MKGETLQRKLEALLWEDDDVRDLYRQVLINQGVWSNELLSDRTGSVVEGNCRTVVYRKLREKQPTERAGGQFPPEYCQPTSAIVMLQFFSGEMHVAGKNTWTPFEKAGHVYRMHNDFALIQDEIAFGCGCQSRR